MFVVFVSGQHILFVQHKMSVWIDRIAKGRRAFLCVCFLIFVIQTGYSIDLARYLDVRVSFKATTARRLRGSGSATWIRRMTSWSRRIEIVYLFKRVCDGLGWITAPALSTQRLVWNLVCSPSPKSWTQWNSGCNLLQLKCYMFCV